MTSSCASPPSDVLIRRADARDLAELGELGAALMRAHYAFDPLRFLEPGGGDDARLLRSFLASQLDEDGAVVFVAERQRRIVGYVYAAIEPLSWKDLRDECGFIHDLLVSDAARGGGIGEALARTRRSNGCASRACRASCSAPRRRTIARGACSSAAASGQR